MNFPGHTTLAEDKDFGAQWSVFFIDRPRFYVVRRNGRGGMDLLWCVESPESSREHREVVDKSH